METYKVKDAICSRCGWYHIPSALPRYKRWSALPIDILKTQEMRINEKLGGTEARGPQTGGFSRQARAQYFGHDVNFTAATD